MNVGDKKYVENRGYRTMYGESNPFTKDPEQQALLDFYINSYRAQKLSIESNIGKQGGTNVAQRAMYKRSAKTADQRKELLMQSIAKNLTA